MVKADSKITQISELAGKKVGITSAGSGSDVLGALDHAGPQGEVHAVPLGGGGLVPNLLSGNVDAVVLYSPLSFKVMQEKQGAQPDRLRRGGAAAPERAVDRHRQVHQGASRRWCRRRSTRCSARVVFLQDKANRAEAVKLIAEIDEIPRAVAEAELDGNLKKLSTTGEMKVEWMDARARHGAADRHDGPGAGAGDLRRQVQAGADEEVSQIPVPSRLRRQGCRVRETLRRSLSARRRRLPG